MTSHRFHAKYRCRMQLIISNISEVPRHPLNVDGHDVLSKRLRYLLESSNIAGVQHIHGGTGRVRPALLEQNDLVRKTFSELNIM